MMHPKYERARMLGEAIEAGVRSLGAPIDRIEVTPHVVTLVGGLRRLKLNYGYSDAYAPNGSPLLGGGHWSVWGGPAPDRPASGWRRWLAGRIEAAGASAWAERGEMLQRALNVAAGALEDPIETLSISGRRVTARAGAGQVVVALRFGLDTRPYGDPPGTAKHWIAEAEGI